MELMMMLDTKQLNGLKEEFEKAEDGLSLEEFVEVMLARLDDGSTADLELITGLSEFFAQVDVNGDGAMEWDEFTAYCIEAGMAATSARGSLEKAFHQSHGYASPLLSSTSCARYFPELQRLCVCDSEHEVLRVYDPLASRGEACTLLHELHPTTAFAGDGGAKRGEGGGVVQAIEYCAGMNLLVLATNDLSLSFWDTSVFSIGDNLPAKFVARVFCPKPMLLLRWSSARSVLYAAGGTSYVIAYDVNSAGEFYVRERCRLSAHRDMVQALCVIDPLSTVVTGGMDGRLVFWDSGTHTVRWSRSAHSSGVRQLALADDELLLSLAYGNEVLAWDLKGLVSHPLFRLRGHRALVCAVVPIPNTETAVTLAEDGTLKWWDTRKTSAVLEAERCMQTFRASTDDVPQYLLGLPAGRLLAIDFSAHLFELLDVKRHIVSHIGAMYNPNSSTIVVAADRDVKIWSAQSGLLLRWFHNVTSSDITSFIMDARKRKFIIGTQKGNVQLFNDLNGAHMKSCDSHRREISALVHCPEDKCILTASWDRSLLVFDDMDPVEGILLRSVQNAHATDISAAAYSYPLSLVASASNDGVLRLWDWQLMYLEGECVGHSAQVTALRFIEPFPLLFSADAAGNMHLWLTRPHLPRCLSLATWQQQWTEEDEDKLGGVPRRPPTPPKPRRRSAFMGEEDAPLDAAAEKKEAGGAAAGGGGEAGGDAAAAAAATDDAAAAAAAAKKAEDKSALASARASKPGSAAASRRPDSRATRKSTLASVVPPTLVRLPPLPEGSLELATMLCFAPSTAVDGDAAGGGGSGGTAAAGGGGGGGGTADGSRTLLKGGKRRRSPLKSRHSPTHRSGDSAASLSSVLSHRSRPDSRQSRLSSRARSPTGTSRKRRRKRSHASTTAAELAAARKMMPITSVEIIISHSAGRAAGLSVPRVIIYAGDEKGHIIAWDVTLVLLAARLQEVRDEQMPCKQNSYNPRRRVSRDGVVSAARPDLDTPIAVARSNVVRIAAWQAHYDAVCSIEFVQENDTLLTMSADSSVACWHVDGTPLGRLNLEDPSGRRPAWWEFPIDVDRKRRAARAESKALARKLRAKEGAATTSEAVEEEDERSVEATLAMAVIPGKEDGAAGSESARRRGVERRRILGQLFGLETWKKSTKERAIEEVHGKKKAAPAKKGGGAAGSSDDEGEERRGRGKRRKKRRRGKRHDSLESAALLAPDADGRLATSRTGISMTGSSAGGAGASSSSVGSMDSHMQRQLEDLHIKRLLEQDMGDIMPQTARSALHLPAVHARGGREEEEEEWAIGSEHRMRQMYSNLYQEMDRTSTRKVRTIDTSPSPFLRSRLRIGGDGKLIRGALHGPPLHKSSSAPVLPSLPLSDMDDRHTGGHARRDEDEDGDDDDAAAGEEVAPPSFSRPHSPALSTATATAPSLTSGPPVTPLRTSGARRGLLSVADAPLAPALAPSSSAPSLVRTLASLTSTGPRIAVEAPSTSPAASAEKLRLSSPLGGTGSRQPPPRLSLSSLASGEADALTPLVADGRHSPSMSSVVSGRSSRHSARRSRRKRQMSTTSTLSRLSVGSLSGAAARSSSSAAPSTPAAAAKAGMSELLRKFSVVTKRRRRRPASRSREATALEARLATRAGREARAAEVRALIEQYGVADSGSMRRRKKQKGAGSGRRRLAGGQSVRIHSRGKRSRMKRSAAAGYDFAIDPDDASLRYDRKAIAEKERRAAERMRIVAKKKRFGDYSRRDVLRVGREFFGMDTDGSGSIDAREFMNNPEMQKPENAHLLRHLSSMFEAIDKDHSGTVQVDEMLRAVFPRASRQDIVDMALLITMPRTTGGGGKDTLTTGEEMELRQLFDLYDKDKSGTVDMEELVEALNFNSTISSHGLTKEDLQELTARFDADGNRQLDWKEFQEMFKALYTGDGAGATVSSDSVL